MKKNKYLLSIILYIFNIFLLFGSDMDFGVFNYNLSRLIKIERWFGNKRGKPDHIVDYIYNDEGLLKNRVMYTFDTLGKKLPIYESELEYDLEKKIISEKFGRYIFKTKKKIEPVILKYVYNKKNQLINYKRINLLKDNECELSVNVDIVYNNKDDVVYIEDKQGVSARQSYFPGECLVSTTKAEFAYEYYNNKKIRYAVDSENEEFKYHLGEFIIKNGKLIEIVKYKNEIKKERFQTVYIRYDNNDNVIETELYADFHFKDSRKYKYEYDIKNRLIKKIIYKRGSNNIKQIEEYTYENGNYFHFPYLLPSTKIVIYSLFNDDIYIDRSVF